MTTSSSPAATSRASRALGASMATLGLVATLVATAPAQAAAPSAASGAVSTVTVREWDPATGRTLAVQTLAASSAGKTQRVLAVRKGGSPSAKGCRTVTEKKKEKTLLGASAYTYTSKLKFCWDRKKQVVTKKSGSAEGTAHSQFFDFVGNVTSGNKSGYYDWGPNNGKPKSAFLHHRRGKFTNDVPVYGKVGTWVTTVEIRAYADGTWSWTASTK